MAQNQAYLFLIFSITGVIIGFLFDFFRILRRSIKTINIVTYIEDILFWVLAGLLILYNIWFFNNGEIRIFMFFGIVIGVLIYMLTLSNILIGIFTKFLQILFKFLKIPFKVILEFLKKRISLFMTLYTNFRKKFANKKGNFEKNGE